MKKLGWNLFSKKDVYFYGIVDSLQGFPIRFQEDFESLCQLYLEGKLKLTYTVFPLEDAVQAHQRMEGGKAYGNNIFNTQFNQDES